MGSQTPLSSKPHIIIAGAGLGGLTLAQCLCAKSIPFTVFERDPSADARSQGWSIALHTMLPALLSAMPNDMPPIDRVDHLLPLKKTAQLCFYDTRVEESREMRFVVESQEPDNVGHGQGRIIRANRDRLREWLMTSIDVQWGKKAVGLKQDEKSVTVEFADATTAVGDFLVGADGVRSAIRGAFMPDVKPDNVPECFVTGELTLNKEQYERQMRLAHSSYAVFGEGFHIFAGLTKVAEDANSAEYSWDFIWHDPARVKEHHWTEKASKEELYKFTCERTKHVDPIFTELISLSEPEKISTPPLILRDMILGSMPVSRVTLLGDAAHPMTPFRGEGGCHAMEDAIRLAEVLDKGRPLNEYQDEMLRRGSNAVKMSRDAGNQENGEQNEERKAWGQPVRMQPFQF